MLELLTTDHFATWFSALAAGPAEDVAATLEVIVQLGTRTEAPGSSEWLLWYEHPSFSQRHLPYPLPPELVKFSSDWGHFNGYVRRVIKHLESAQFVGRMAHLPPADAAAVSAAVERIRRIREDAGPGPRRLSAGTPPLAEPREGRGVRSLRRCLGGPRGLLRGSGRRGLRRDRRAAALCRSARDRAAFDGARPSPSLRDRRAAQPRPGRSRRMARPELLRRLRPARRSRVGGVSGGSSSVYAAGKGTLIRSRGGRERQT